MPSRVYPFAGFNEPISSWSHYLGAAAFLVLGILLLVRGRGNRGRMAALGLYAVCGFALLAISGTFHLLPRGTPANQIVERLDHAAIFLFIAGTYTPCHMILFTGPWRWGPLIVVWSAAVLGVLVKTVWFESIPESVGLSLYLALGWFGLIGAREAAARYGWGFVTPLLAGAVAFTVGALVEFRGVVVIPGVIHGHEVWHLAALLGAALHWVFIYRFANGELPPRRGMAVEERRSTVAHRG